MCDLNCPDWKKNKTYNNKKKKKKRLGHTTYSEITFLSIVVLLFYVHGKHLRSCRDGQFFCCCIVVLQRKVCCQTGYGTKDP